jgi:septum formation inhibitor-activating ATPase MinD
MAASSHTARVVTVLNLKGGVGKTHTTWVLASICQERGKRQNQQDAGTKGRRNHNECLLRIRYAPEDAEVQFS